jgi:hypothetical protein
VRLVAWLEAAEGETLGTRIDDAVSIRCTIAGEWTITKLGIEARTLDDVEDVDTWTISYVTVIHAEAWIAKAGQSVISTSKTKRQGDPFDVNDGDIIEVRLRRTRAVASESKAMGVVIGMKQGETYKPAFAHGWGRVTFGPSNRRGKS